MSTIINATTTNGVVIQPDNSGSLVLQTNNGTTALTIDTSQRVGIGTTSPQLRFHAVGGQGAVASFPTLSSNSTAVFENNLNTKIALVNAGGAGVISAIQSYASGDTTPRAELQFASNTSSLNFLTANTERMRIDSSGRVTTPYQPMFSGYRLATPTTVAATNAIIHNQVFVNVGSNYDTSNGRFTAPIAGYYEVIIFAHAENSTPINCGIYKNGSNIMSAYQGGAAYGRVGNTAILSLAAGDYIQHYVTYGTIWAGDISGASMSVKLIG